MKKLLLVTMISLLCINLVGCSLLDALYYSISGEIIDPVGDFSNGSERGSLVFGGKTYIQIEEFNGKFEVDTTEEDMYLGQTSNFPFFPNFDYHANAEENADYILAGSATNHTSTCVYLREDLYQEPLCYVLQDADFEFDFLSAFVPTEEVSKKHVEGKTNIIKKINFYVKDFPRLTVTLWLYNINEKWYFIEHDEAFVLSEAFANVLLENELLS